MTIELKAALLTVNVFRIMRIHLNNKCSFHWWLG